MRFRSAWAKSIRPFKNARRVNSPGKAGRAPNSMAAPINRRTTAAPPWHCISARSLPVKDSGPRKKMVIPSSMTDPGPALPDRGSIQRPRIARRSARAGWDFPRGLKSLPISSSAPCPSMRTIAIAPCPGAVALATIKSC